MNILIGKNGFIGQTFTSQFSNRFNPIEIKRWESNSITEQIRYMVKNDGFTLFWAAGKTKFLSSELECQVETKLFTEIILNLAKQLKKIFFISSCGGLFTSSEGELFNENSIPKFRTYYGENKFLQEKFLESIAYDFKIKTSVFRLTNVYGLNNKSHGFIHNLLESARLSKPFEFTINKSSSFDYIHVNDAFNTVNQIIAETSKSEDLYNKYHICNSRNFSLFEIVDYVESLGYRLELKTSSIVGETINSRFESIYEFNKKFSEQHLFKYLDDMLAL